MAQKTSDKRPETGWGEMLEQHFKTGAVRVDNRAANGRSTKSFIDENRWQKLVDDVKKGDYVFIEFGHNDEKKDKPEVYAEANSDYRSNLIRFVNEVRAKKAIPVLLTPVARRKFDSNGNPQDTHGEYPAAVKSAATETKTVLIDMQRLTEIVLKNYGIEKSKTLFLHLKPGENPNYPNGVEDNTHFNQAGAEEMAKLAVSEIRHQKIGLRKHLKQ